MTNHDVNDVNDAISCNYPRETSFAYVSEPNVIYVINVIYVRRSETR